MNDFIPAAVYVFAGPVVLILAMGVSVSILAGITELVRHLGNLMSFQWGGD